MYISSSQSSADAIGPVRASHPEGKALIVDLEDILLNVDFSLQSAFVLLTRDPASIGQFALRLLRGRASVDSYIANAASIDASLLPYNEVALDRVRRAVAKNRTVYLVSSSNERYVRAVANHLGLFAGVFASNSDERMSASVLRQQIDDALGRNSFECFIPTESEQVLWPVSPGQMRNWLKLMRVHQWTKNFLIFVPMVTAQRIDPNSLLYAILAFVSFSLIASGAYIINDLVDIDADRAHVHKKHRPLAAGTLSASRALIVAALLTMTAISLAISVSMHFAAVIALYLLVTTAYSLVLKRKMLVDVIVLAGLYTIRVVGGAVAIVVPLSEWLLGFSMFVFVALALVKRYVELTARIEADLPEMSNRNYRKSDLGAVAALMAAASFNAVTVFALYISSDTVHHLYRHAHYLWLICPILIYWFGRLLMLAHRRELDDDPILFALRDKNSLLAFVMICGILISAI
ncbi:UbiA family prenyltransferase [Bradyrhizobium sp. UFLA05-112]